MHQRGRILNRFVELVEEHADDLAWLLSSETGKPIKEAIAEIGNCRNFVNGYVEKAKHLYGESLIGEAEPGQEKCMQITVREPIGVIAAIIPFNFPCDLFGQKDTICFNNGEMPLLLSHLTIIRLLL